ncbi:MAG: peptide-methionine (R)-S-oxide reductase MsrB [Polyangiales bacterium]
MNRRSLFQGLFGALVAAACDRAAAQSPHANRRAPARSPAVPADGGATPPVTDRLTLTDAQWRQRMTPEQFHVMREQGTERAFTGAYWNNHERGTYLCSACGNPLFRSEDKFDSGTGWPSYTRPLEDGRVAQSRDDSLGMTRNEVHCARCGGHLGHVFDDGPPPTGLRYCINSVSLAFRPR